jgi:dTDP-4-amino-4,6-dideoxygalactose transaminase
MHLQPIYRNHKFVTMSDSATDAGSDIFHRGLCLPSDIKMTAEQQEIIIQIVRNCFQ